jgi:hypothetical protein
MAVDNNNRSFALPSRSLSAGQQGVSGLTANDVRTLNQPKASEASASFGQNAFNKPNAFGNVNNASSGNNTAIKGNVS